MMTVERKVNLLIVVVVVLIVLVVWLLTRPQPGWIYGSGHVNHHDYLAQMAKDLRKSLSDMDCRIYMLGEHPTVQHPYNTQTKPTPCPPPGPSLVPKDPP